MPQQKAGGGPPVKVSRTPAPSRTLPDHSTGVRDSSTRPTATTFASRSFRERALRTTLAVTLGLTTFAALILGAGWLADHMPNIVVGFCIVALGVMFGALLAAKA